MIRSLSRALLAALAALALVALIGCSGSDAKEGQTSERPPVAVETSKVVAGDVQETVAVIGTLAPKFQGDVKAEYSGTITDVYVSEWVRVKKGTLLARFDRREPDAIVKSAVAATLQARVGANRARRELERMEKLRTAGLATQQNLDDARAAAEAADAQLDAAQAQEQMARTRLAKTEVRAPMDGVVAARTVNPGDFIENMGSKKPMFSIVDNNRLELTASVPSSQISKIALGQTLTFTVDAVPGRQFSGQVSHINPAADEENRTVRVIVTVENPDGLLKSGLFARGSIVVGGRTNVLRVPRSAMLTWDASARTGVLFAVEGTTARQRTVGTGMASGEEVEITSGLQDGDTVVTRGAFNLRDGDVVAVPGQAGA